MALGERAGKAGRHEVSRYLRQEIERKDKWRKNGEDEGRRRKSRHAGGRYGSQDKSFHTAIEADFEERASTLAETIRI